MYVREISKYIKSKYFFIASAAIAALVSDDFFSYFTVFNDGGLIAAVYYITNPDKLFAMAALLIVAIPCVVPISDEIASGCYRNYIFRMGKRRYFASRIIATVVVVIIITAIALTWYLIGYMIAHHDNIYLGYEKGSAKKFRTSAIIPRLIFLISRFFYAGIFAEPGQLYRLQRLRGQITDI